MGTLLTAADLKRDVKDISSACLEECLDIHRIRPYFSKETWLQIQGAIQKLKAIGWLCRVCKTELDGEQVGCDGCLEWHHFSCVGLCKAPKAKTWFCRTCFVNL